MIRSYLFALAILTISCNQGETPRLSDAYYHQQMIHLLDSMDKASDPLIYFNLNERRAAYLEGVINKANPDETLDLRFNYGLELLKAGATERAIVTFSQLLEEVGPELDEGTKLLYEMLALSYFRLGEQANCVNSHNTQSCILPLREEGLFVQQSGPMEAIRLYEEILNQFPDDLQSIWIYNLAHMALGQWPEAVPQHLRIPEDLFNIKDQFSFTESAIPLGLDLQSVAGGVCMEDFTNDGFLDLFVTGYLPWDQSRFFINNGDGTFKEKTSEANLTGIVGGLNTIHADYNNDSYQDILILRGGWLTGNTFPNSLLRNNGDGTFTDVTISSGLLSFHPTQAAGWADYDGDGWLDLFIANESFSKSDPHPCELFHSNGDGTFSNLAKHLGVDFTSFYKGVTWGDINNDQRPDLYISDLNGPNILLLNQGGTSSKKWKFENQAKKLGLTAPFSSFPTFFFDYNNDGNDDLLACGYELDFKEGSATPLIKEFMGEKSPKESMCIYRNNGNMSFTDVADSLGMNTMTYGMGHNFGDLDNDGFPDIIMGTGLPDLRALIPNRAFRNLNGSKFEDVSMGSFGHIQKGHGVALGDLDNDGDLDIYIVMGGAFQGDLAYNLLYLNNEKDNNFIHLSLQGVTCNRDAIGAKIKINTRDKNNSIRTIWTSVNTGGSFGSSSLRRTIGIGKSTTIESLEVIWPKTGIPNSIFTGLEINTSYKIIEGALAAEFFPLHPLQKGPKTSH